MKIIGIVDYGMGNLRSVSKAFEYLGYKTKIIQSKDEIKSITHLVLPGVGAFKDAIANLEKIKLKEEIIKFIESKKPFLGICLGYQILFSISEEFGLHKGFDILKGRVKKFPNLIKIPHMGWNKIYIISNSPIFKEIPDESYFYFNHSFYVDVEDKNIISSLTDYGVKFASSISYENIFAVQFHPEKSQKLGLKLLNNFAKI